MSDRFKMIAKTFQGLENVLADELRELGAENVEVGRRAVEFEGDKRMLYRANFCCRCALRILKPIYTFYAHDADELYREVSKFNWDSVLTPERTFAIEATVNSEEFRHSRFVTYKVKDAIADYFTSRYGKRPSIRLNNPDLRLDVHISEKDVSLALDSSGESLHKRGWRVDQTEAPINEVLAAGILRLAGWKGESDLIDPMCGSGTFLIEAAMMARNIYPGVYRSNFAFEHWTDFDADLFEEIYNDDSAEREFNHHIYGTDISPKAIAIAAKNIRSAGVAKYVTAEVKPFQAWEEAPEGGILVTNPPYGERLTMDELDGFYRMVGSQLKNKFKGYNAWLIGPATEVFAGIGLKPSVKYPLLNGSIECELRKYEIFDGRYSDFVKEGGRLSNDGINRDDAKPDPLRKPFVRDRKPFDRDRKPFDRDRKPFDRDRKPFDRDHKPFDRDRKPFDRDRKPFDRDRTEHRAGEKRELLHGEEFLRHIIRDRQPRLGAEAERPVLHGRRKSWKRLQEGETGSGRALDRTKKSEKTEE